MLRNILIAVSAFFIPTVPKQLVVCFVWACHGETALVIAQRELFPSLTGNENGINHILNRWL